MGGTGLSTVLGELRRFAGLMEGQEEFTSRTMEGVKGKVKCATPMVMRTSFGGLEGHVRKKEILLKAERRRQASMAAEDRAAAAHAKVEAEWLERVTSSVPGVAGLIFVENPPKETPPERGIWLKIIDRIKHLV